MLRPLLRHLAWFLGYTLLGIALAITAGYSLRLDSLPDLKAWHTTKLESEFSASNAEKIRTIAEYQALEARLFAELKSRVLAQPAAGNQRSFNRYSSGSIADPLAQPVNWNATFVLTAQNPRGSILLLHGLTDSPYVMRALGERLNRRGYHVVGLRLPGHGTAPSGLLDAGWQDFASAVRMAARDLTQHAAPGKPLYMIGFSTGAALAVEYALSREKGENLPAVSRLVLLSPAIGVSPAAALAVWQKRAGRLLGIPKLDWTDIVPEYDPYKYNSFPVNAAEQIHELTGAISAKLDSLSGKPASGGFPSILAFQSVADSTVSAPALIQAFFRALKPGKHELVLFDINRQASVTDLYTGNIPQHRQLLLEGPPLPFDLTMLANQDAQSPQMAAIRRNSKTGKTTIESLSLAWPASIFSLSHLALPISPADPVYGSEDPHRLDRIYLGAPQVRGETGVLAIPPSSLGRLRYNPFFDYMAGRIEHFIDGE